MALPPAAITITIRETIALLDGPFATFASGVAEDLYAFWLGSGISFGRVDGLKKVVPRVIEFLRKQIDPADQQCRFRRALEQALDVAPLTEAEKARSDFEAPFSTWPDADAITERLTRNYAKLLDCSVDGEADDYLLWDGVGISATFANPHTEPDVEHLCIAMLVLEGVASCLVTPNWDGLIERAQRQLSGGHPAIVLCIRAGDWRAPSLKAFLYKFHGCAVKATEDEATYRPLLVGRQSQINSFSATHKQVTDRLIDIITSKPTLMMGLSAQDFNIQNIFAHAEDKMPWQWPGARPSYVFSTNELGMDQKGLLGNVYRAAYGPATRDQIAASSLIQAYAKPLLIALVLHVLCAKIQRLIELAPGKLAPAERAHLKGGAMAVRNLIADAVGADQQAFVLLFIKRSDVAVALFREGRTTGDSLRYQPLVPMPVHQIAGDGMLLASGLTQLAVAAGILGIGVSNGTWTLESVSEDDPEGGVVRIRTDGGSAKVFFAANSHAALSLQHGGYVDNDDDAIVVHSLEVAHFMQRSPRRAPGRTGRLGLRDVSIADLLAEALNSNELFQGFRERAAI